MKLQIFALLAIFACAVHGFAASEDESNGKEDVVLEDDEIERVVEMHRHLFSGESDEDREEILNDMKRELQQRGRRRRRRPGRGQMMNNGGRRPGGGQGGQGGNNNGGKFKTSFPQTGSVHIY